LFGVLVALPCLAEEVDVTRLYEVSTVGTTAQVKAGQKGKMVLAINTKGGAHISDEAPISVELTGSNLTLEKQKLVRADARAGAAPTFEVGFTGGSAGKGSVDAKMSFFVCTEKVCAKQQKIVSLPVDVQ